MKIVFAIPIGQDLGGIITSTEQYVAGLRECGHTVLPICVVFTKRDSPMGSSPRGKFAADFVPGEGTGWLLHPTAGWRDEARVSLGCEEGIDRFISLTKDADLVIWASMYGFRNEATEGSTAWTRAITANAGRNVFFIHDDHLPARYPWAGALAPYARAYVGVQPCSYESLAGVNAPRAMIYTPLRPVPRRVPGMADRGGYFMCQVWKPWKNGDKLVAAAPLMPRQSVIFAGDGIQLRYMKSPEKCPPRYAGMWSAMLRKQTYMGVLSEKERDKFLRISKFLVDLSTRGKSAGQYNRVAQEAMAQGCVVVANPDFITGAKGIFQPGLHYLPIMDYDPKAIVEKLREYDKIAPATYKGIQRAARDVLGAFERTHLARQIVNLKRLRFEPRMALPDSLDAFRAVYGGLPCT